MALQIEIVKELRRLPIATAIMAAFVNLYTIGKSIGVVRRRYGFFNSIGRIRTLLWSAANGCLRELGFRSGTTGLGAHSRRLVCFWAATRSEIECLKAMVVRSRNNHGNPARMTKIRTDETRWESQFGLFRLGQPPHVQT